MEDIEELIKNDPHIVSIQRDCFVMPNIDYSKPFVNDYFKKIIDSFKDYLHSPYIIDNCSNSEERKSWKKTIKERGSEFTDFINRNCLRPKFIFRIRTDLGALLDFVTLPEELVKRVSEELEFFREADEDAYSNLSLEDKFLKVREMKERVYRLLLEF